MKGNQPALLAACLAAAQGPPCDTHQRIEKGHGRVERRTVSVFSPKGLAAGWRMHVRTVVAVRRQRQAHAPLRGKGWEASDEWSYYVCNRALDARHAARLIRRHWHIENRSNWVRDETMGEDACTIRVKAGIALRIRTLAYNILRAGGERNMRDALFRNLANPLRLYSYPHCL